MEETPEVGELIEQCKRFTYENFATKSEFKKPNALSHDWLVWSFHVTEFANTIDDSPIRKSIIDGLETSVLGHEQYAFESAKNKLLNGLIAADRLFGKSVPASDRTVTLGHNSPEQTEALEKIDRLVEAVTQANDLPGSPEDKEQVLAELSAGRKLLEAATVRAMAVRETLRPALRWIFEKGAGAMIGKMAGDLLEYLVHLKFW